MPLKHHTETAYLIFLALVMCVSGFIVSLLPPLPEGLTYCLIFFALAALYPIVLLPTFKRNRVDYEFRLLHWFPAGMFFLWLLLQISDPYWTWFHILNLGFFFLWSLPMVAFGLVCIILFSIHVIRRRTVRVPIVVLFLVLFTAGSLVAESKGWNERLQANFSAAQFATLLSPVTSRMRPLLRLVTSSQVGSGTVSQTVTASASVASSDTIIMKNPPSSSVRAPVIISDHMPKRLPKSGPEFSFVLFVTLLGLYIGTLHARNRERA